MVTYLYHWKIQIVNLMFKQKTLSLLALFLLSWSMQAQVSLTFQRTGTTAESVKVQVRNAHGQPLNGVTASVVSTSHDFKSSGNAITEAIVCPNVNATSNPTIDLVFKISGLAEATLFNALDLDIHALNNAGNYQESGDKQPRRYVLRTSVSDNGTDWTGWINKFNFDIAEGINTNGKTHKLWGWMSKDTVKTSSKDFYLKLNIKKGTQNQGCFFGISSITLKDSVYAPVSSTPLAKRLGIYYHPCGSKTSVYLTACNITGQAVSNELHYAATSDNLKGFHHIERHDSAEVARGGRFNLDYAAQGLTKDYTITAYFDWDADGIFETKQEFLNDASGHAEIQVPADAKEGRVRMRMRLNDNGLEYADEEVHGMLYDFFLFVRPQAEPTPPTSITPIEQVQVQDQKAYNIEGKLIQLENHQGIYIQGGQKKIK